MRVSQRDETERLPGDAAPAFVREASRLADEAAAESPVIIRELWDAGEMAAASALLAEIWGMPADRSQVAPGMLVALAHAGNYVSGAFRDGVLVAISVGFFHDPAARALHSHITGVLRAHAAAGIGRALKFHQRAWCLERGVPTMTWTYDPLVSRNAYFNLRKLGGRTTEYLPDHYGAMPDGLNRGQPSDRMLLTWDLQDLREHPPAVLPPDFAALRRGPDGPETDLRIPAAVARVRLELPLDIEALRIDDPALAVEWRTALRGAAIELLTHGWQITDFDRSGHYVAERTQP